MAKLKVLDALAAIALLASSAVALASSPEWRLIATNSRGSLYVDVKSMRTLSDGIKRAWIRAVFSEPLTTGDRGYDSYVEYDCSDGAFRKLQTFWDTAGDGVARGAPSREWEYPRPETMSQYGLDYVCFGRFPE